MNESVFLDLLKDTVWMTVLLAAPVLLVSLVVGVAISLIQAVTQIQEATLTFVPKIIISFVTLIVVSPWMVQMFVKFSHNMFRNLMIYGHP